jgi:hypothetical protein
MEPFLAVRGRLQKDGATLNVIAYEIEALRVPGAPVRRRGLAHTHAAETTAQLREGVRPGFVGAAVRESPADIDQLPTSLPDPLEYWADRDEAKVKPFRYLTALRQNAPGVKNFG